MPRRCAATHPREDFGETFVHCLHVVDTLDTAGSFGVAIRPRGVAQADAPAVEDDLRTEEVDGVGPLVAAWLPPTSAFNGPNRSMGLGNLRPFVLNPAVVAELGFIHDLVRGRIGRSRAEPAAAVARAPVPQSGPPAALPLSRSDRQRGHGAAGSRGAP